MPAKGEAPLLPLLLCEKLGISFALEQSIRLSSKGILQGRYVIGIAPNQLDACDYNEFLNCLSLPQLFRAWATLNHKRCSTLGIGFEPSVNGMAYATNSTLNTGIISRKESTKQTQGKD